MPVFFFYIFFDFADFLVQRRPVMQAVEQMVDGEAGKELEVEVAGEGEAEKGGDVEMVE